MRHALYSNVNAMLSPRVLRTLTDRPITTVRVAPWPGDSGTCGSRLVAIETDEGHGPRLFLKRISWATDWMMRATDDRRGRETLLWQRGLFDRLPPEIARTVIACAQDGPGWAILMRDVSAALLPGAPLSVEDNDFFLNALAALHAEFWEEREELAAKIGFCSPSHYYMSLSPITARRESKQPGDFPSLIVRGWKVLEAQGESGVANLARRLIGNPQSLCRALDRYPQTLVHRDLNLGNLGLERRPRPRAVLLDWQFAGLAPPAVDLAGYLSEFSALLPVSKETAIERYRESLVSRLGSRFGDHWWQPQLELALLGDFVRLAWAYALHLAHDESSDRRAHYKEELGWWAERAESGAKWLEDTPYG